MREQEARGIREIPSDERGSALARLLAFGALLAGIALVGFVLFGGSGGHKYTLLFETGGQLVPDNQVLVAGQPIGSIDSIELTDSSEAAVDVTLERPLVAGSTAQIRLTSLSGIANRYIALHMGPDSDDVLPDGATLAADSTTSPVDLDQLFSIFDDRTKESLQEFLSGQATVYAGREEEANRAYKFLAPSLTSTQRLLGELNRDSAVLEEFLVSGSSVLGAVAERRDDLSELTQNANEGLGAIARENEALDRTLSAFPPAMRQANTTFVNLRAALDDLDPLIETTGETTEDLPRFLRELRPVAQRAVPVVSDLRDVFDRQGSNNDLADALRVLPKSQNQAEAAVPRAIDAFDQTQDEIALTRPYTPDLLALITNLGQAASYYDANGHYIRAQPAGANIFQRNPGTGELEPISPAQQNDLYPAFGVGPFLRCPGAATQPIPGSNPFLDDGNLTPDECNPADVIPGL